MTPIIETLQVAHGFAYVASPYSHKDDVVRAMRASAAFRFLAWCAEHRLAAVSPIAHWHEVAVRYTLPFDAAFWMHQNEVLLSHAQRVFVLCIEGWKDSVGVTQEVVDAKHGGVPVFMAEPLSRGGYALSEDS